MNEKFDDTRFMVLVIFTACAAWLIVKCALFFAAL